MSAIVVKRYTETGTFIETVDAHKFAFDVDYHLYGGCGNGTLTVFAEWDDDLVVDRDDQLTIEANGVRVFSGRVIDVNPELVENQHTIGVEGWWSRLNELAVMEPRVDRLTFGDREDSDQPTLTTAFQVVKYLLDTFILPDTKSPITYSLGTSVIQPAAPCKFGVGGFAIYARDKLTKVLEILAAMEDCVVGIDANNVFYYLPRGNGDDVAGIQDDTAFDVRVAETPPANWKSAGIGIGLSGTAVYDRRGPNALAIHSRDTVGHRGIRTYRYAQALSTASRRVVPIHAPNVGSGQGARRLAKGLFRRFSDYELKLEDLQVISGTRRLEPHLGRVRVYDGGELLTERLAGKVHVKWDDPVSFTVYLGENSVDPGSGNPLTDPFVTDPPSDDAQIDTGDGSDGDYPIPSEWIDEDDGFDGDGDDLFTNGDRDDWSDPSAGDGVDYGSDLADGGEGSGTGNRFPAIITASSGTGTYGVDIYRSVGGEVWKQVDDAIVWSDDAVALTVGTKVFVNQERGTGRWVVESGSSSEGSSGDVTVIVVPDSYG